MAIKVKLTLVKPTPKFYRYETDPDDQSGVIVNAYIPKTAVDGKPRKNYFANITEEEDPA